ncbi:hypothetical protein [Billgrantia saliphila]|uniref:hypothetical protein n=1 Tax=Billgrantia saliphila TaxID=1848458 RepID=UPI000CE3D47B|nr:hypothetical protein [Halomonas saliphila]
MNLLNMPGDAPDSLATTPCPKADDALCRRLARAKLKLDRLERDVTTKDLSALTAARVEFALAARKVADALVAQGLGSEDADRNATEAAKGPNVLPPAPWEAGR